MDVAEDRLAPRRSRPAGAVPSVAERLRGVDAARALAIFGMVMVHVGPRHGTVPGAAGTAYGLTYGRASVLFVVLAGVGVSLLTGDRSPRRLRRARGRLLWRVVVLFPLGLALQELDTGVAVILQYYAVYFLVAIAAAGLPDRWLAGLAAALVVVGPAVILVTYRLAPSWYEVGGSATIGEPAALARALLLTGYYPTVTWAPPLLAGMWLGRRDLRAPGVQRRLMVLGGATAASAYAVAWALGDLFGTSVFYDDVPFVLLTAEGHTEMPLSLIGATAVAVTVLGAALRVASRLPRLTWPLVATGQLALSIYVGHLLVLHVAPELLVRRDVGGAAFTVARFAVVTVAASTLWRTVAPRGPLEAALHAPFALAGRRTTRPAPPPAVAPPGDR